MIQHAGLGYRRDLAEDFLSLSDDSPIRFIEAAPENWLKMGGRARKQFDRCLLYTSPSPRDRTRSRMPSSA